MPVGERRSDRKHVRIRVQDRLASCLSLGLNWPLEIRGFWSVYQWSIFFQTYSFSWQIGKWILSKVSLLHAHSPDRFYSCPQTSTWYKISKIFLFDHKYEDYLDKTNLPNVSQKIWQISISPKVYVWEKMYHFLKCFQESKSLGFE